MMNEVLATVYDEDTNMASAIIFHGDRVSTILFDCDAERTVNGSITFFPIDLLHKAWDKMFSIAA